MAPPRVANAGSRHKKALFDKVISHRLKHLK